MRGWTTECREGGQRGCEGGGTHWARTYTQCILTNPINTQPSNPPTCSHLSVSHSLPCQALLLYPHLPRLSVPSHHKARAHPDSHRQSEAFDRGPLCRWRRLQWAPIRTVNIFSLTMVVDGTEWRVFDSRDMLTYRCSFWSFRERMWLVVLWHRMLYVMARVRHWEACRCELQKCLNFTSEKKLLQLDSQFLFRKYIFSLCSRVMSLWFVYVDIKS